MAITISNAMATSFKKELLMGGHCFNANQTGTCTSTSTATVVGISFNTANVAVGMAVTGTNWTTQKVIAIDGANAVTVSAAPSGATTVFNVAGDQFKMLLLKSAASGSGTYDAAVTNVGTPGTSTPSTSNVGTDETSGTGYTSGGTLLQCITPTSSGTTAYTQFSNPSWSTATFTTCGAVIYNTTTRLGGSASPFNGRVVSTHTFSGDQSVSSGTFTVVMPTADASNALLRLA